MMATYEIDYFELPSESPAEGAGFFSRAFGWGSQAFGPGYVEIRDGGVLGGLNGDSADRSAAPLIGIRTDDIAAAAGAIVAAGGTITRPAYDFPGGRRLFFRVPGGVEMMVYQPAG
jgi:predicted enzyme related to lactoylglutathione lyase